MIHFGHQNGNIKWENRMAAHIIYETIWNGMELNWHSQRRDIGGRECVWI